MRIISTLFGVLCLAVVAMGQKTISGKVTDANNEGLLGASVIEMGTGNGTITDFEGNYSLSVSESAILELSYVGYATQTIEVSGLTNFDFVLNEGVALDEVVVTALGISRAKKGLTYAVDEIDADELTTVKNANVVNTLAGKAAGVFINRGGTGVGSSARVLLRGSKSSTNNQPLYVIDGVPMTNRNTGDQSGVFGGGIDGGDGISNINPEDIASISILKGASAAALYGSQAANGVILITTKRGASGKAKINFSSSLITESVNAIPDLQYSYGQTSEGAEFSWGGKVTADDHVTPFFQTGTNWVNAISISGGRENMQSYFSYANSSASGIIPTNDLNRHNFSFNQSAQFFDDKLILNGNVNFINQKVENRPAGGLYFNPLTGLYFFPRGLDFDEYATNFETFSADRNFNTQNWVADRDIQQNPHWILNRNLSENIRNRAISTVSAKYKFTDWLSLQARGNIDRSFDRFSQHVYATTQATLADNNGRFVMRNTDDNQVYGDVILGINKQLSDDLALDVNLGVSHSNRKFYTIFADSKDGDLSFANIFSLQNLKNPLAGQLYERLNRVKKNAAFASAQLGIKNTYYLDVSARNDWSSTLPTESYLYPSFGATVILSELMDVPAIDFAKFRVSYAIVGNDVDAYSVNNQYDRSEIINGQWVIFGEAPFLDTELKPERSKSFEVGLELKTWNNRLGLDLTYYQTNTINQFVKITGDAAAGLDNYIVNAGDVQNAGIEAMITLDAVKSTNFNWTTSLNFTRNKNEVLEVYPEFDDTGRAFFLTNEAVNSYAMAIQKGGSFGDIWGVKFMRNAAGQILIDDDGKPMKDPDLGFLGNPNPDFMLGWNNEFSFKSVFVKFLIDGRFGGEVMSITEALLDEVGVSQRTADARDAGGVTIDGVKNSDGSAVTNVPADVWYGAVGGRQGISENYIFDATNIRLRELAIGFSIPKTAMEKVNFIESAKISLIGRNLFFIQNEAPFDPDVTFSTGVGLQGIDIFSLPGTRSLGFNLSLGF